MEEKELMEKYGRAMINLEIAQNIVNNLKNQIIKMQQLKEEPKEKVKKL